MTSLPDTTTEQIAFHLHNRRGIENKSQWVRDVVYGEDHQHAYTAPPHTP